jgi:hypothetical protein
MASPNRHLLSHIPTCCTVCIVSGVIVAGGVACSGDRCSWQARIGQQSLNEPPPGAAGGLGTGPTVGASTTSGTITSHSGAFTLLRS